jgi:tetratricopeptide (TPR) repeat protein
VRGLNFKPREASAVPDGAFERADLAWAAATGLTMVDLFGAAAFSCRNLLLALKTSDPFRIARGLLLEAISRGVGPSGRRDMEVFIGRAAALVEQSGNAYLAGLEHLARASYAFSSCRFGEALEHAGHAESIFHEQSRVAWWELATSRATILFCLVIHGEIAGLHERCSAWMRDARERGDRFSATTMGVYAQPNLELYRDRPEEARRILDESLAEWPEQAFQVQSLLGLLSRGYVHLYLGEGRLAWELVQSRWPLLKRFHVLRHETNRITLLELRARSALCSALDGADREELLRTAERDIRQLESEVVPSGPAYAARLRACLADARGDRAGAAGHLERAEQLAERMELPQMAAAARRARGILVGSDAGARLVKESDALLLRLGVANPQRFTASRLPISAPGLQPGGRQS